MAGGSGGACFGCDQFASGETLELCRSGRASWFQRASFPAFARRFRGAPGGWADQPSPGRVSARAADEADAAWVAEIFRTRYFDFRIKHFHELIVGLPMVSVKTRWLYEGRRQRHLDATDRHAICGDDRPRAYQQPVQHPPHTAERVVDCIKGTDCVSSV